MALTRKFLKAMGIEDEKIDQIIDAHTETVEGLKQYKADAEKLPAVQQELEETKKSLKKFTDGDFEKKYNDLKKEYDDYKTSEESAKELAKKQNAYKEILKKAGISDKRIDAVLRVADLSKIEFKEDGSVKDSEALEKAVKDEWSDFIVKKDTQGASTATPPENEGDSKGHTLSRAAEVAKRYYAQMYGEPKKGD